MFEKLFPKKVKDKYIQRFWRDFSDRAELFVNILQNDERDSEDFIWMQNLVGKSLKLCCLDSAVGYDFSFETQREPVRLVFYHKNDDYLKKVGEKLAQFYPENLKGVVDFTVAE